MNRYLILENLKERSRKENTQFCLAPKNVLIKKKNAVEIHDKQTNFQFNVITPGYQRVSNANVYE